MGTIDVGRDKPIQKKLRGEPAPKETPDVLAERIEKLNALFPEAVAEGKIDWQKLRAALGNAVDERPERYSFSWAGKREAIRVLQAPGRATLIPAKDESVNFEATQNVFIEGENLEVLKLLYKPYFGRVKMIYIDPPYNTGNDFIYPDNFTNSLENYLKLTGQKDGDGNLLTSNPETSGRYHSTWLSMMYSRLFLARQLLREDGVIFISIDDHEIHNLRLIMNEIFGEESFIASFTWKSRHNVDSRDKRGVSTDHEYILCYGKRVKGQEKDIEKYSNSDNDPRGPWMSDNLVGLATKDKRPNLHYDLIDPATNINYGCPEKGWRYAKTVMMQKIAEGRILWPSSAQGRPRHKKFLNELQSKFTGFSTLLKAPNTSAGTQELRALFGVELLEFPKPTGLLKLLIKQAASDADVVLDFFAGSCTTAQAVLELNREDGGNRRFICVQLLEPTTNAEFPTIADIGKERIRRVIKKMKEEAAGQLDLKNREAPEDLGFKVFKLAESNWRPWVEIPNTDESPADPQDYADQMAMYNDSLLDGWTPENVIYEAAIKEGFGLGLTIDKVAAVPEQNVLKVTDPDKEQSFYICLDQTVALPALEPLALTRDDMFVCRDCALDDTTAANLALQCRLKTI